MKREIYIVSFPVYYGVRPWVMMETMDVGLCVVRRMLVINKGWLICSKVDLQYCRKWAWRFVLLLIYS